MENTNESASMIHMFTHPVFCVKNGMVTEANHYANQRLISVGAPIESYLDEGVAEYKDFRGCSMSLTLRIEGAAVLATVIRFNDMDVFHVYGESINEGIRAMALVAQELAEPLTDLLSIASQNGSNPQELSFKKSLYQLRRISSNISVANAYIHGRPYGLEVHDMTAVFSEIFEDVKNLSKGTGLRFVIDCPEYPIYCPVDLELLKKAIYNLISNAIKGALKQSTIRIKVSLSGERLQFSIQNRDNGLGSGDDLFSRHMRAPQIEDSRHGIGLGIPIAQLAASTHNGTLLMDRPKEDSIRFTLTISTRTRDGDILRSPVAQIDFFGGLKQGFVELADVLPTTAFKKL